MGKILGWVKWIAATILGLLGLVFALKRRRQDDAAAGADKDLARVQEAAAKGDVETLDDFWRRQQGP